MSDEVNERAAWECTTHHPLRPRWSSALLHCPICGSGRPARREGAAAAEDRTEELASINHELVAAHNALLATLARAEARAEAAERKVAAVERLAKSVDVYYPRKFKFGAEANYVAGYNAARNDLRAALRDEPTP